MRAALALLLFLAAAEAIHRGKGVILGLRWPPL